MDPSNPFGVLTFIVAPAILTNASSVMVMGTVNRFLRAIDRVRALSTQLEGKENNTPEIELRIRQLDAAGKRVLIIVRALTAFYLSVGSFAAASLVSLVGAVFFPDHELSRHITMAVAFCAGVTGIGGLVTGSSLLVSETRMSLRILREETKFLLKRSPSSAKPFLGRSVDVGDLRALKARSAAGAERYKSG